MRSLFSQATGIYGYPSVGPSGKSVSRPLKNYLQDLLAPNANADLAFRKNLEVTGMVKAKGLTVNRCEIKDSVVQNVQSIGDVTKYVETYGAIIPVAAVDLLLQAKTSLSLSDSDFKKISLQLQSKWSYNNSSLQKQRLCPLVLAGYANWLPATVDCHSQTSWIQAK